MLSEDSLEGQNLVVDLIIHPFAIILSQDCDLTQDWAARQKLADEAGDAELGNRLLRGILFAEVNTAEDLRSRIKKTEHWKRLTQNKDERYHFLEAVPSGADAVNEGLPELGIDFKRYFTLPAGEVYRRVGQGAKRRCRLASPYLEHLSTRYYYFQQRVALPEDHQSV